MRVPAPVNEHGHADRSIPLNGFWKDYQDKIDAGENVPDAPFAFPSDGVTVDSVGESDAGQKAADAENAEGESQFNKNKDAAEA
jgi:hypothetical protein